LFLVSSGDSLDDLGRDSCSYRETAVFSSDSHEVAYLHTLGLAGTLCGSLRSKPNPPTHIRVQLENLYYFEKSLDISKGGNIVESHHIGPTSQGNPVESRPKV
jgi:hypothetical protein